MRRAALIALTLAALPTAAGTVDVETRGQAQIVARRQAIDRAVADLATQSASLEVRADTTLGQWLATRPDEALRVAQALRDATVLRDEPASGEWCITLALTVADLNDALQSRLRRGLAEDDARRLTGRGAVPIPWRGRGVNTVSRPSPSASPITVAVRPTRSVPLVIDPRALDWENQVTLMATGQGATPATATGQARRALIEALRALPVGPAATVGDWAALSPAHAASFEIPVRAISEVDRHLTPTGICEVELAIPLRGLSRVIRADAARGSP